MPLSRPLTNSSVETFSTSSNVLPAYSVLDSLGAPQLENESSPLSPSTGRGNESAALRSTGVSVEMDEQSTPNIPPRYSMISDSSLTGRFGNESTPHFEHTFVIPNGKPWATLRTFMPRSIPGVLNPLQTKPDFPLFYGDGPVTGILGLDLQTPQTVQQITISIRGSVLSGFVDDSVKFLDYTHSLWHKQMGDPRSTSQGTTKKFEGKLLGSYQFPFSLPVPTHVDSSLVDTNGAVSSFPSAKKSSSSVSSRNNKPSPAQHEEQGMSRTSEDTAPLSPPSFDEKAIPAGVTYELVVQITHGRLKPDSKIRTGISYMPSFAPRSGSLKRQEAYSNNAMPPGPLSDPDGWFSIPKCVVKGELPGAKQTSIDCSLYLAKPLSYTRLYLAKPLSYTRGATIPCFLSLASEDSKGLALLCSPKNPRLLLVRHVRHINPHNKDSLKTVRTEIALGVWWIPSKEAIQEPNVRHLQGEIHLPSDMMPSCALPVFKIEYSVEFFPFVSNVFKPFPLQDSKGNPKESALLSCPVEIATLHNPDFPRPLAFTEPKNFIQRSNTPRKTRDDWDLIEHHPGATPGASKAYTPEW